MQVDRSKSEVEDRGCEFGWRGQAQGPGPRDRWDFVLKAEGSISFFKNKVIRVLCTQNRERLGCFSKNNCEVVE